MRCVEREGRVGKRILNLQLAAGGDQATEAECGWGGARLSTQFACAGWERVQILAQLIFFAVINRHVVRIENAAKFADVKVLSVECSLLSNVVAWKLACGIAFAHVCHHLIPRLHVLLEVGLLAVFVRSAKVILGLTHKHGGDVVAVAGPTLVVRGGRRVFGVCLALYFHQEVRTVTLEERMSEFNLLDRALDLVEVVHVELANKRVHIVMLKVRRQNSL